MSGWLRGSGARKLVVIGALVVVTVATRSQPVLAQQRPGIAERAFVDSLLREEGLPVGLRDQCLQRARRRGLLTATGARVPSASLAMWQAVVADLAVAYTAAVHRGLAILEELELQVQLPLEQRRTLSAAAAEPFFAAVLRNVGTTPDEFRAVVRRVAGPDSVRLTAPFVLRAPSSAPQTPPSVARPAARRSLTLVSSR